MQSHGNHSGTIAGTAGGTILAVFSSINSEDVVKTVVLALIGAAVSFGGSLFLKWISKGLRKR